MADLPTWDAYPPADNLPPVVINDPALPLVSIVTPSYNQGQFIAETIESVLTQDYPNIEYWVVDGGSTDETISVLKSYEDDPRFHWLSEPDRGQSDAINKGWSRCRGKIVAYLNSDDTYCPHAIRSQVEYLLQNPEIDVVYGDCVFIDADSKSIRNGYSSPFQFRDLLRFSIPYQPTLFLTKRALDKAGPLDSSYHFSMDSEYWLRLNKLGFSFTYNPKFIATYRLHNSSKTVSSHPEMHKDWQRLTRLYAPPEDYDRALADLHLNMAIDVIETGDIPQSIRQVKLALSVKWTRRILLFILALVSHYLGESFYEFILDSWVRVKRQR